MVGVNVSATAMGVAHRASSDGLYKQPTSANQIDLAVLALGTGLLILNY